jgi:hypothetical protein
LSPFLTEPPFQAGIAPFAVALVVALLLRPLGLAWLALPAALATTVALTLGLQFTPLTAARKGLLLVAVATVLGAALDRLVPHPGAASPARARGPAVAVALALGFGLASIWVFQTVLAQQAGGAAWVSGAGLAGFVAVLVALMLRLRADDGGAAAASLGLGLAVGVSAFLSASIGNLMNAVALAAAGGALLLVIFLTRSAWLPGWLGTLVPAVALAGFAANAFMLAELRALTLALLLLVPLVAALPLAGALAPRPRLVLRTLATVAAAVPAIASAWRLAAAGS